eukprot:3222390-Alexandrium_andersonii.AAC.1
MYRNARARHIHYPNPHKRPTVCYHKKVRFYMAEASGYGDQNTPEERTDGRRGRVGWFTIGEARAM